MTTLQRLEEERDELLTEVQQTQKRYFAAQRNVRRSEEKLSAIESEIDCRAHHEAATKNSAIISKREKIAAQRFYNRELARQLTNARRRVVEQRQRHDEKLAKLCVLTEHIQCFIADLHQRYAMARSEHISGAKELMDFDAKLHHQHYALRSLSQIALLRLQSVVHQSLIDIDTKEEELVRTAQAKVEKLNESLAYLFDTYLDPVVHPMERQHPLFHPELTELSQGSSGPPRQAASVSGGRSNISCSPSAEDGPRLRMSHPCLQTGNGKRGSPEPIDPQSLYKHTSVSPCRGTAAPLERCPDHTRTTCEAPPRITFRSNKRRGETKGAASPHDRGV